jgi:hypothetical protein
MSSKSFGTSATIRSRSPSRSPPDALPEYTRGRNRAPGPAYREVRNAIKRSWYRGDRAAVRELRQQLRGLPSGDPRDPGFRRLRYARYADDHLLGFTGPKAEAEEIKARLAQFLHDDLKLELNQDKTLVTHGRSSAARFLGYEITVQHSHDRRNVNGGIRLRVPRSVIKAKCAPYSAHGQPERRTELMNLPDRLIISTYGAEYRGIVQYYLLAGDVWRLNRLEWVAETSVLKTLAAKHGCECGTSGPRCGWCQYPEMAWCRLAALTACSEQLFVHSTPGWR